MALTLVPTPIAETIALEPTALALLQSECLKDDVGILVEEHKIARQRWLKWGLPRTAIDKFELLNEHTAKDQNQNLIKQLKTGKKYFLMSDCGLPAFCDPGQLLVNSCHEAGIRVTSTPFSNSVVLALALSGFSHKRFYFAGFLPADANDRKQELEKIAKLSETIILMDTPYRLKALITDLAANVNLKNRLTYLATNLNQENERCLRDRPQGLISHLESLGKREFIVVINESSR